MRVTSEKKPPMRRFLVQGLLLLPGVGPGAYALVNRTPTLALPYSAGADLPLPCGYELHSRSAP